MKPDVPAGHIGHGEDHEGQRIFRHVIDQTAIGRDVAGMQPIIDDATQKKSAAETKPWLIIWKIAPCTPCMFTAKVPIVT